MIQSSFMCPNIGTDSLVVRFKPLKHICKSLGINHPTSLMIKVTETTDQSNKGELCGTMSYELSHA